jgi:hypothetical protein
LWDTVFLCLPARITTAVHVDDSWTV